MAITLNNPQLTSQPKSFTVSKWFGPMTASVRLPDDMLDALLKMTDKLIEDERTLEHGSALAGVINKELKIFRQDMHGAGCDEFLETAVRTYIDVCIKEHDYFNKDNIVKTAINSCWSVSQYENEYNPLHNHTGCQISAVLYLKVPDLKGRRKTNNKDGKQDNDGDINFVYGSGSQRSGDILEIGLSQFVPEPGILLMFPSNLLHTVYPFVGEGERRSVAFDATYSIKSKEGNYIAGDTSGFNPNKTFYTMEKPK